VQCMEEINDDLCPNQSLKGSVYCENHQKDYSPGYIGCNIPDICFELLLGVCIGIFVATVFFFFVIGGG
jgi:hypothetical protein